MAIKKGSSKYNKDEHGEAPKRDLFKWGSRPHKYTPELLANAKNYVNNFEEYGNVTPTVAGMCLVIGIHKDTCYEWLKHDNKEEFKSIYASLMMLQEQTIIDGALSKKFDSAFAKIVIAKHGYTDKKEVDLTSSDGSMTPRAFSQEQYKEAETSMDEEFDDLD